MFAISNRKNRFSLYFTLLFAASFFCKSVFAQSYVSTSEVVNEIERALISDKNKGQNYDVYKNNDSKTKEALVINHEGKTKPFKKSDIQIIVADPKAINTEVREKEKFAYNALIAGQDEVAVEFYKQVISAEPDNKNAKFSLAIVYQRLNQYRQAKNIYYELLKGGYEKKEEIIGNLISIMVDESPKDSVYLLSRLISENPQSSYIIAQSALAFDKIKNYDQAIDLFKKAISIDPNRADYFYNLAVICDKAERYEEALNYYFEVVKKSDLSDQSLPIDQVKKRIDFIRNS